MSDEATPFPWGYLDLEGPSSDKDIRKAYARKLKAVDQRTDPEGFQTLRQAYEAARKVAPMPESVKTRAVERLTEQGVTLINDREIGRDGRIPKVALHSHLPIQTNPENTLSTVSGRVDPAAAYLVLTARMRNMVKTGAYDIAAWTQLLNDPVLDDFTYAQSFEQALVLCLTENKLSESTAKLPLIAAPKGWVELIERRYGWVADGLKFARRFPGNSELYQELRKKLDFHSADRANTPQPLPPKKSLASNFVDFLVLPWPAWLILAAVSVIWSNLIHPSNPSVFSNPIALVTTAFCIFIWVALKFENTAITYQGLSRLRLEFLSRYLVGAKIVSVVITPLVWMCAFGMALYLLFGS